MSFLNRCIWTATSAGVVDFAVSAAAQGGYTPTDCLGPAVVDGATYHYFAVSGAQHEEGDGVYTSSTHTIARTTIRNSSNGGSKVNFTSPPVVTMGGPVATDVLIPAVGSLTWNVASTGSDSNPGTASSPFKTLQKAINVARSYDWQSLYFPTISIASGTYNEQVLLPILFNCPNGGVLVGNTTTPANVVITDLGTAAAITTAAYSTWQIAGVTTAGTFGGVSIGFFSTVYWNSINLGGTPANYLIYASNNSISGTLNNAGTAITVTATSAAALMFSRGEVVFDAASITFANAVNFTQTVMAFDSLQAFFGFIGGTFVNPGNVTVTGNAPALLMTSGAFFEANSTSLSGGVVLSRSNFPAAAAGGVMIDYTSTFQPDGQVVKFFNLNDPFGESVSIGTKINLQGQSIASQAWANTAIGYSVMAGTLTAAAVGNTGIGVAALFSLTSGSANMGIGAASLVSLTTGTNNNAFGGNAGNAIVSGSNNTILGSWPGSAAISGVVALADGAGNLRADYGNTTAATWTFGAPLNVTGALAAPSVRGTAVAFASRPGTPVEGMMVAFTDSNTNVWGATIAGSGANHVLGYYNGTNWTVAAK